MERRSLGPVQRHFLMHSSWQHSAFLSRQRPHRKMTALMSRGGLAEAELLLTLVRAGLRRRLSAARVAPPLLFMTLVQSLCSVRWIV